MGLESADCGSEPDPGVQRRSLLFIVGLCVPPRGMAKTVILMLRTKMMRMKLESNTVEVLCNLEFQADTKKALLSFFLFF